MRNADLGLRLGRLFGRGARAQGVAGTLPCHATGCGRQTGAPCSLVDRRHRRCGTAWCPEHQRLVAGAVYCPRHAGLAARLRLDLPETPRPDADDRAASLCAWMAGRLDAAVRADLESMVRPGLDTVVVNGVRPVVDARSRQRSWEQGWKLTTYAGVGIGVVVEVREDRGDEVIVRVNRHEVARQVPPWITARREGRTLGDAEDAQLRTRFEASLLEVVGLEARRQAEAARSLGTAAGSR